MPISKLVWAYSKPYLMQLIYMSVLFFVSTNNQSNKQETHTHVQYTGTLMYRILHAPTHTWNSHSMELTHLHT